MASLIRSIPLSVPDEFLAGQLDFELQSGHDIWTKVTQSELAQHLGEHRALQIILPPWDDRYKTDASGLRPLPEAVLGLVVGPIPDFSVFWAERSGIISVLQQPTRFFLQTPFDDGPYFSYVASVLEVNATNIHDTDVNSQVKGYCVGQDTACITRALSRRAFVDSAFANSNLSMLVVPMVILQDHIRYTRSALLDLIQNIEDVEQQVTVVRPDSIDHSKLIRTLHSCNAALIKLERRHRFETRLASALQECVAVYKVPGAGAQLTTGPIHIAGEAHVVFTSQGGMGKPQDSRLIHSEAFKELDSEISFLARLSRNIEYDLSVSPRRIENQFTALYNLIAQRDASAGVELAQQSFQIAEASHKIAQDTLRDSSSMKTVAVLTLAFLPATFLCSFFSMTFFNWNAAPGQPRSQMLWLFFAAAIPLTIFVVLLWLLCTRTTRQVLRNWISKKSQVVDLEKQKSKR